MRRIITLILILITYALLSGCAASLENVKIEKITICENQKCRYLTESDSKEYLLVKMFNIMKTAEGRDNELFASDPINRIPEEKGISFFVQGGPIPGMAKWSSVKFTDILYLDRENMEIKFKVSDKSTWLGTPLITATTEGILSMKSLTGIKLNYSTVGAWLVMPFGGKAEWLIDYIDLDNKVLGAYYAISVAGTGFGGGSGYQLVKLMDGGFKQRALVVADSENASMQKEIAIPKTPEPLQIIPPALFASVAFTETSGNRILEGGEKAVLKVDVENRGEGVAKDVQIVLSGNPILVSYWGERISIGNIGAKEKKMAEFKAVLPPQIATGEMEIKIAIKEAQGFSPSETKILKIVAAQTEQKKTVEVISELPRLVFTTYLKEQNNNRVLDGGEDVSLKVTVENKGEGTAKDVQVFLSGNKMLTDYLGEKKFVGDIKPGEKKSAEFKTVLPAHIPSDQAMLKIELKAADVSASEVKILKIAMRPKEIREVVEVISEMNVDDLPLKTKDFERKEIFALVIGISKYRDEIIPSVKYASRDAEVIAKYLENVGGLPKNNIKVLTDTSATKSDIEAYIDDWLVRRVNKDSTIFVYYAGHGTPDFGSNEAYIVPYEGHPEFPSKLYSLKRMYESLNKLSAKNIIVMLDSCFSGASGRSITKSGSRPLVMSIENSALASGKINILAASTGTQISSDYDKVKHGLFTYYLLRGMRGEADKNGNGIVELGELYNYVKTNVSEKASLELNRDQTPVLLPFMDVTGKKLTFPIARIR